MIIRFYGLVEPVKEYIGTKIIGFSTIILLTTVYLYRDKKNNGSEKPFPFQKEIAVFFLNFL